MKKEKARQQRSEFSEGKKFEIEDDDRCDLDPTKKCDNCFKCLNIDALESSDYARIPIEAVYLDDDIAGD